MKKLILSPKQINDIISLAVVAINSEKNVCSEHYSGELSPVEEELLYFLSDNPNTFDAVRIIVNHIEAIWIGKSLKK